MDRRSITAEALRKQGDVAKWFKKPEVQVKLEAPNMYKCTDSERSEKLAPFLLEIRHGDKACA